MNLDIIPGTLGDMRGFQQRQFAQYCILETSIQLGGGALNSGSQPSAGNQLGVEVLMQVVEDETPCESYSESKGLDDCLGMGKGAPGLGFQIRINRERGVDMSEG